MKVKDYFYSSLILIAVSLCLAPLVAWCEYYPSKPIRVIMPFAAGGSNDRLLHLVGTKLTEAWGQQVIADYRPGAGSVIGTEIAAKAAPNGYTLLIGPIGPMGVAPSLYSKLPYDPVKDFAAITMGVTYSNLLVVPLSLPVKSVQDLIALARSKPGQLNFSSSGAGASNHLSAELFKLMAKVDLLHVPYKG